MNRDFAVLGTLTFLLGFVAGAAALPAVFMASTYVANADYKQFHVAGKDVQCLDTSRGLKCDWSALSE